MVFSLSAQAPDTRSVIARTQQDIGQSLEFERGHHGKQMERYENAQRHLSDFDREFTKGHFENDKLDQAIDDVKNLVEHNTLDPGLRDALTVDLRELRLMRAEHGH